MERKCFEHTLPDGYREAYTIDATSMKTGLIFTLLSLVPVAPLLLLVFLRYSWRDVVTSPNYLLSAILFILSMIVYVILHELTHGLAYKCLTKQKLTFGLSWSCAFCGVPQIYVYRRGMMLAVILPFAVFSLVLIPLFCWVLTLHAASAFFAAILLSIHMGGCVGDLYVFLLLLFKYRDSRLLMRDTGPKQTLYLPPSNEESA